MVLFTTHLWEGGHTILIHVLQDIPMVTSQKMEQPPRMMKKNRELWVAVAKFLDKCCFVCFSSILTTATVVLLMVLPYNQRYTETELEWWTTHIDTFLHSSMMPWRTIIKTHKTLERGEFSFNRHPLVPRNIFKMFGYGFIMIRYSNIYRIDSCGTLICKLHWIFPVCHVLSWYMSNNGRVAKYENNRCLWLCDLHLSTYHQVIFYSHGGTTSWQHRSRWDRVGVDAILVFELVVQSVYQQKGTNDPRCNPHVNSCFQQVTPGTMINGALVHQLQLTLVRASLPNSGGFIGSASAINTPKLSTVRLQRSLAHRISYELH